MSVYSLQYGGRTGTFYVIKDADEIGGEIVYTSNKMSDCLLHIRNRRSEGKHFWKARIGFPNLRMIAIVELPKKCTYSEAYETFSRLENEGYEFFDMMRADI